MYKFTICEENDIPWTQIESCSDSNIFHTRDWMKFLIVCKGLKPFVVRIHLDKKLIGFFIGYKFKKIGLNIIGSPLKAGQQVIKEYVRYIHSIKNNVSLFTRNFLSFA